MIFVSPPKRSDLHSDNGSAVYRLVRRSVTQTPNRYKSHSARSCDSNPDSVTGASLVYLCTIDDSGKDGIGGI